MVSLEKITWDNWEACINLRVKDEQKPFIASNVYSLAQSYVALLNDRQPPLTYAICLGRTVIGFAMAYRETARESRFGESSYVICRFMIDKDYQGRGYGKMAFAILLDKIKDCPLGSADAIYVAYNRSNEAARALYAGFGFKETGVVSCGEMIARLPLDCKSTRVRSIRRAYRTYTREHQHNGPV
ncbi:MAG TPA: GNAT family N-acetyltransferase [Candidatus Atribacteria bacterium]|nr:GNAT family N-acetyltransferase [Candidatus Atribacteria bacterium]